MSFRTAPRTATACRSIPPRPVPRAVRPGARAASGPSSARSAPPASRARTPAEAACDRRPCPVQPIRVFATPAPSEHPPPHSLPASALPLAPTCHDPAHRKKEPANPAIMASSMLASSPVASLNHKISPNEIPNDSFNCGMTLNVLPTDIAASSGHDHRYCESTCKFL